MYEKSLVGWCMCLSLPHLPQLQPSCCWSHGVLPPSAVAPVLNAESEVQKAKRLSPREPVQFSSLSLRSHFLALHPPCPSFPWLVVARGGWCWQAAAGCLAGSPGQPARLFRAHSCFPGAGSAEQETGCLGSLTVSKH